MLLTSETQVEQACGEASRTQSRDPHICKKIQNKLLDQFMIKDEVTRDEVFAKARELIVEFRPAHKQAA